jgi:hypothetical protein
MIWSFRQHLVISIRFGIRNPDLDHSYHDEYSDEDDMESGEGIAGRLKVTYGRMGRRVPCQWSVKLSSSLSSTNTLSPTAFQHLRHPLLRRHNLYRSRHRTQLTLPTVLAPALR